MPGLLSITGTMAAITLAAKTIPFPVTIYGQRSAGDTRLTWDSIRHACSQRHPDVPARALGVAQILAV